MPNSLFPGESALLQSSAGLEVWKGKYCWCCSRLLTSPNEDLGFLLMHPHAAPNFGAGDQSVLFKGGIATATASFKTRSLGLWDILIRFDTF